MVRDSREEWKTRGDVFDRFTLVNLQKLVGVHAFDALSTIVSPGKEATVFAASKEDGTVAVKIYKLQTAKFTKMYSYIRVDPRYQTLKNNQRQVIFAWTEREYRNLLLCRTAGVRAPMPIAHRDHILVMEFLGHDGVAAPLLKQQAPTDPEAFAAATLAEIEKLARAGLVHGDLSEYNIINLDEEPVLIDFSHTTMLSAPNSWELLERDVRTVCAYFIKLGVDIDVENYLTRLKKLGRQE